MTILPSGDFNSGDIHTRLGGTLKSDGARVIIVRPPLGAGISVKMIANCGG